MAHFFIVESIRILRNFDIKTLPNPNLPLYKSFIKLSHKNWISWATCMSWLEKIQTVTNVFQTKIQGIKKPEEEERNGQENSIVICFWSNSAHSFYLESSRLVLFVETDFFMKIIYVKIHLKNYWNCSRRTLKPTLAFLNFFWNWNQKSFF